MKICIIGGCGHIGLVLGLTLAEKKHEVTLFDISKDSVDHINAGRMPFDEPGAAELLARVRDNIWATTEKENIKNAGVVIIATYGKSTLDIITQYSNYLDKKLIIISSTLGIGETVQINNWLKDNGYNLSLAYCPERVSQGDMLFELKTIPQIISGVDKLSVELAGFVFSTINPKLIYFPVGEAEFAKLYSNTHRYLTFTIANQMFMSALEHDIDLQYIHNTMMSNNPRGFELFPGAFTAGPCLPKDAKLLSNASSYKDFINSAIELNNNAMPRMFVDRIKNNPECKTVGILGMTFKANCTDLRNSLSFTLQDMLVQNGYTVLCHDPYHSFDELDYVLNNSDEIILAVPHNQYKNTKFKGQSVW